MVYIVDDDQYVREGFLMLLKSAGYAGIGFKGAEDFLKFYKPDKNDLLILDMHMPGMNGCKLLENLRETGCNIPVIIVTAYDEETSRDCAKIHGAIGYFRKPVDSEALIDVIKFRLNQI